jgi:two-component system LytT family response regulator
VTTGKIQALIVDDEPLARKRIAALLRDEPEIEIAGEANTGAAAVKLIGSVKPDLVFLDIQMPGLDGFGVLRALAAEPAGRMPLVIFVTARDEFALRAFDVEAVDYILKPVVEPRFRAAVRKAIDRLRSSNAEALSRQMASLLDRLNAGTGAAAPSDRIAVRSGERTIFVTLDDIDFVDVDGDYARLHVGKDTHLIREPLGDLERRLQPPRFVRVHRSFIIQTNRIQSVQPWFKGDYVITLSGGTRITTGRTYRKVVQQLLR